MFQIIKPDTSLDLVGNQKTLLWVSAIVVAACILSVIFIGPTYGIDFKGGSDIIVQFTQKVTANEVREGAGQVLPDVQVQQYGDPGQHRFLVQTRAVSVMDEQRAQQVESDLQQLGALESWEWTLDQPNRAQVTFKDAVGAGALKESLRKAGLTKFHISEKGHEDVAKYDIHFEDLQGFVTDGFARHFGDKFDPDSGLERMETVGASVGEQFRDAGIVSLIAALLFILIYIAFRFDIRYAPGAVVALAHDVILAVGFFTVAKIEFSLPIIAALLTIIGYSLNDTIVVFDRVRENLESSTKESIEEIVNRSLNETMSRTLITSITTLLAVVAIAVLGGGLIRNFAIALVVGVIVGTYSSVFIASPIMLRMDAFLKSRQEAKELMDSQKSKSSTLT